jgi:arylsulfatase
MAWDEKMAVYAAMIDRMDQNIGKLRQLLKKTGADKNTVIMFLSDNGGSHEGINSKGFTPETLVASQKPPSDPTSFTAYEYPWANVSNTPFRSFKHWEFEGGNATPFIAYYPSLIKANKINHKPVHIIDLMPTCLELAGIAYPKVYNGNTIKPLEGISLLPAFKSQPWNGNEILFFEHSGNRAVRKGDWKIVSATPGNKWELYNIKNDRSELINLSTKFPARVQELEKLYDEWAARAGVLTLKQLSKK